MHSVAKLVTKAFPVSGILDNLTEVKSTQFKEPLKCLFEHFGLRSPRSCLYILTGPSRQYSSRWENKSTDSVGLLGEDSGHWNKSKFIVQAIVPPVAQFSLNWFHYDQSQSLTLILESGLNFLTSTRMEDSTDTCVFFY